MRRDDATERQVRAADPLASTWLSANAGSGKTRVLTDRVARLLLGGVQPQRILCLTYTKAAASEMQNRLFKRLGEWAMLDDERLATALAALGIEGAVGSETLAGARRLFARAIETPGGLRIQTIHSFCASLLRRFPLEARVSPQFTELDDRAAHILRREIVEELADGPGRHVTEALARHVTDTDFDTLAAEISRSRSGFARPLSRDGALACFGLSAGVTAQSLLAEVLLGDEPTWAPQVEQALSAGGATDQKAAPAIGLLVQATVEATMLLRQLEDVLLYKESAASPFGAKIGKFPTRATRDALGPLVESLERLMLRVEAARPRRLALAAAERTLALHNFAARFLPAFEARKAARGALDFDDLIDRARLLLTDPSVAQWVLFRLDGGIDHILIDEAQDTSPAQWRVIELLAQEFTTGRGARNVTRTIFVVGDKKQSIYSFQGADLAAFDRMRDHFRTRLSEVETHLADLTLDHSFRSSPAILRLVDMTFDERRGRALGGEVKHLAFKSDMPGRVDLWPVIPKTADPEEREWFDPVDMLPEEHHDRRLARQIAGRIAAMIADGVSIPTDRGPRAMTAGDVLILVQRRSALFIEVIRACKAAGLPIAGADRLKLGAELAVRDLTALLAFLATPEDDLSLAAALRSPLFGWSEGELYDLAHGRTGYLWSALRAEETRHAPTLKVLHDLRDQADFLRPFDLIERMLTRHGGRRALIARLGEEAEDGIDELLSQALAYEQSDVPSLTGFLGWITADDIDVKRQMGEAGGRIRVMTVHGAKGLEAPIVILPETQDRKAPDSAAIVTLADETAVWRMPAAESPSVLAQALADRQARAAAESLRLLYVALTRAQSWLIVAAAGEVKSDECWYGLVREGMEAAGAVATEDGGLRLTHGIWPEASPARSAETAPRLPRPEWLATAPPAMIRTPLLSPSDLGGAKVLPGEADPTLEAAARARGIALHLLLEHLPRHPRPSWEDLAASLLPEQDIPALLADARRVLDDPALADLFVQDALTEVGVTGDLLGRPCAGVIDRLILGPGKVLAIDFKSNRLVPARPEEVPEGLLRQMGAYAALLSRIHPGCRIETAILWTGTPALMPLPDRLITAALARAGFP